MGFTEPPPTDQTLLASALITEGPSIFSATAARPCHARGECPKKRLLRTPDGEPGLNYLCLGLKRFFWHSVPVTERLTARLKAAPPVAQERMRRG
jgi:hypothetical protein